MKWLLAITALLFTMQMIAQPLAFPGAEGFGAYTTGGRGGRIIEVTNLNDSGTGSLRAAIGEKGARTVVFRVSGIIELKSSLKIKNDSITIAGQTAPGQGITLRNYTFSVDANNVIVRFIRSRPGDTITSFEDDAMNGRNRKNIIIDHCSMSWSVDEAVSFYDNENFTMQWCLIAESLYKSQHDKGNHGYGGIWGGMKASFHHNLIANHTSRNPRFCGARYHMSTAETEIVDFRNNVIYNWGFNSAYGGESGQQNMVNNYFKYGPATEASKRSRIVNPSDSPTATPLNQWFVEGNYVYGDEKVTADNWNGGVQGSSAPLAKIKASEPFPSGNIVTQTAEEAYEDVLKYAGCINPYRDILDRRYVLQTREGFAYYGDSYGKGKGIIDSQESVGAWPELTSDEAPLDSDHDGMPDDWEDANGLNKLFAEDRNNLLEDSTTMVEVYLNHLAIPVITTDTTTFVYIPADTIIVDPIDTTTIEPVDTTTIEPVDTTTVGFVMMEQVSGLKLYPNPARNLVTVQYSLENDAQMHFTLVDMSGRIVLQKDMEKRFSGFNSFNIDVSGFQKGIYFLNMTSATYTKTMKLIVR